MLATTEEKEEREPEGGLAEEARVEEASQGSQAGQWVGLMEHVPGPGQRHTPQAGRSMALPARGLPA